MRGNSDGIGSGKYRVDQPRPYGYIVRNNKYTHELEHTVRYTVSYQSPKSSQSSQISDATNRDLPAVPGTVETSRYRSSLPERDSARAFLTLPHLPRIPADNHFGIPAPIRFEPR